MSRQKRIVEPAWGENRTGIKSFDIPAFVVSGVSNLVGENNIFNVTPWFIEPDNGLRIINNADEIAYLEYGAA